jgi:hypothetical protein
VRARNSLTLHIITHSTIAAVSGTHCSPSLSLFLVLLSLIPFLSLSYILFFFFFAYSLFLSSFLGSTAQLRPWPPLQNPAEFLGGFSTIFFFTG